MIGHRVHELSTWVGNSFSSLTVQGGAKKQQLRKLLFMLLLEKITHHVLILHAGLAFDFENSHTRGSFENGPTGDRGRQI